MVRNLLITVGIVGCLNLAGFSVAEARTAAGYRPAPPPNSSAEAPAYCNTAHNVGRMALGVSNDGTFGTQLAVSGGNRDCFTGETLPSAEFPKGSRTSYLFAGALWIGAILGRDTLVSTGADGWSTSGNEFHPETETFGGKTIYRSTIDPEKPDVYAGAISEQDFISQYRDTCNNCSGNTTDYLDGRRHRPLNLEVSQSTYAWSYSYAQDFVLFDYGIKNIGQDRLRRVFMGFYVDADIHDIALEGEGAQDDLNGFREWQPALYLKESCPQDSDQVNIAWTADNDGDLDQLIYTTVPHVSAMRIIRTPSDSLEVSFNWWVSNGDPTLDYGPQKKANPRVFGTGGSGTPEGDRNKFFILSNGEFDFDQAFTASISSTDSVWLPPPPTKDSLSKGLDTRYVLSFGPFDIEPNQTLPISLAYVAGVNFHKSADNFNNLPNNPESWYGGLNFDSLGSNATWAEWVYDNPGVDTDSDGYAGVATICNLGTDSTEVCDDTLWDSSVIPPEVDTVLCHYEYDLADTIWRKGDGVPDFRGATPPPAPSTYSTTDASGTRHNGLRVVPGVGRLTVRWNGTRSESTADVFSREIDFEGYRVYLGRDDRRSSYAVASSYDIEDFNRWDYNLGTNVWELNESPFTLQELRCLYADSCSDILWHPSSYPRSRPLVVEGAPGEDPLVHYFEPQDFNQSVLGHLPNPQTKISKRFKDALRPPVLEPDSIRVLFPNGADSVYLTEEGFIKYYEYELVIDGLLPTVPYWVNVTAFDYGSPSSGLEALETSPTLQPSVNYPLDRPDQTKPDDFPVFVWPNPYRVDADYRDRGFEGRGFEDRPNDRVRLIHFANLPEQCVIRIYSLDGDLVREFEHPNSTLPFGCAQTLNEDCWDLITRNQQLVVSGMYYWTVEDEAGNIQIGKLVVIM